MITYWIDSFQLELIYQFTCMLEKNKPYENRSDVTWFQRQIG
jgi:hypothetical protein